MPLEKINQYNLKDLTLDVSLTAVGEEGNVDLMGKKTFSTSFFKDGIGFGITNVTIEINTGLQPILEVTMKDLYGKTIYGDNNTNLNTKVLFDWPPPKFKFSFKGYLGRKVSWLMNLKTTSIDYDSNDGSYNIKCSFVPNQWGFFADIPFVFLNAVKTLRTKEFNQSKSTDSKNTSQDNDIFSITKIGVSKEQIVADISSRFSETSNNLINLKNGNIDLNNSGAGVKPGFLIKISNVPSFVTVKVPEISDFVKYYPNKDIKNLTPAEKSKVVSNLELIPIIDSNISILEKSQLAEIGNKAKSMLDKLTIKEALNAIARDSGFLMGCILKAGRQGYFAQENYDLRKNSTEIIGKSFPLIIDSNGEEKIAKSYGTENYEEKFVNDFINSLSEGIVRNSTISNPVSEKNLEILKNRINNAEIIQNNPYKSEYLNIMSNIFARTAIISFITKSEDPNKVITSTKSDLKTFLKLADKDLENIDINFLTSLDEDQKPLLERTLTFLKKIIDDDGNISMGYIKDTSEYNVFQNQIKDKTIPTNKKDFWNLSVSVPSKQNYYDKNLYYTLNDLIKPVLLNINGVDENEFTASAITNNNIKYESSLSDKNNLLDFKTYILFRKNQLNIDSTNYVKATRTFDVEGFVDLGDNLFSDGLNSLNALIRNKHIYDYSKLITNQNVDNYFTDILKNSDLQLYVLAPFYLDISKQFVFAPFSDETYSKNQRALIKYYCNKIFDMINSNETKSKEKISNIQGNGPSQSEMIYKQMHNIFHQWDSLLDKNDDGSDLPKKLQDLYGGSHNSRIAGDTQVTRNGAFVYDYPLQNITKNLVDVSNAIISTKPVLEADSRTTVLNMIQNICRLNNFTFVPFPGDGSTMNIKQIFEPYESVNSEDSFINYFHVLFLPTPESRGSVNKTIQQNGDETIMGDQNDIKTDAIEIKFGSPDNEIVKSININTTDNKPTAESILNVQNLIDPQNRNKILKTDCSMLSIYEGRSYTMKCELLGNAQLYPFQYFYFKNFKLFGGLYQTMKVNHTITPNNMTSSIEGIKMRFSGGKYGGIMPITSDSLRNAAQEHTLALEEELGTNYINNGTTEEQMRQIMSVYGNYIKIASDLYGVPQNVILSFIYQESRGNQGVVNGIGAVGLMQVIPRYSIDTIYKRKGEIKLNGDELKYLYEASSKEKIDSILNMSEVEYTKYTQDIINDPTKTFITINELKNPFFNILVGTIILMRNSRLAKDSNGNIRWDLVIVQYNAGIKYFNYVKDTSNVTEVLNTDSIPIETKKYIYSVQVRTGTKDSLFTISNNVLIQINQSNLSGKTSVSNVVPSFSPNDIINFGN